MKYLFGKLLNIVHSGDTFFLNTEIPNGLKITDDLIRLNYSAECPFDAVDFIFIIDKNQLYVWFFKYKLEQGISVPDTYIIYKNKKIENGFIEAEGETGTILLTVKDYILVSQVIVPASIDKLQYMDYLSREYNLEVEQVESVRDIDLAMTPGIALPFMLNREMLRSRLQTLLSKSLVPLIIFFAIMSIGDVVRNQYYGYLSNRYSSELKALKKETVSTTMTIDGVRSDLILWENFESLYERELKLPSYLSDLFASIDSVKGTLSSLSFNQNKVNFMVECSSSALLIKEIQKNGAFKKVKLLSSVPDRENRQIEKVRIEIILG